MTDQAGEPDRYNGLPFDEVLDEDGNPVELIDIDDLDLSPPD